MEAADLDEARGIAERIAGRYASQVEMDASTLADELLSAAMFDYARGGFDPSKGAALGTWLHRVMASDAMNMARNLGARRRAMATLKRRRDSATRDEQREDLPIGGAKLTRKHFSLRWVDLRSPNRRIKRRGRRGFSPMGYLAAAAVRRERGWSWNELWRQMGRDADLRRALGFDRAPSLRSLKGGVRRVLSMAPALRELGAVA